MMPPPLLKSPYPYYGGKSTIAPLLWAALGDCRNFVDPFFGSGAVLLGRPYPPQLETVNDLDAHIPNFWRAMQHDPEGLARLCDTPVSEVDQHAFHTWLVAPERRETFTSRLMGDPNYYDLVRAARWCAGLCMWIGGGWCSGDGPWQSVENAEGHRQLVRTDNNGEGISKRRVHLGDAGGGIHRQLVHLGGGGQGLHAHHARGDGLHAWFAALQARLRYVRVCCGDWTRVLGPSVTWTHGLTGIVLDPPYQADERDDVYATDTPQVAEEVHQWALANGDNPLLRIVLCGYETPTHTMPDTWEKVAWETNGGYGNQGEGRGRTNSKREVLWCSPGCLKIGEQSGRQIPLFA